MYITYADYLNIGGTVNDEAAFAPLEVQARRIVDRRTQNRLQYCAYDEISEDVKFCVKELIDLLDEKQSGPAMSSYSNDGVSVTYEGVKNFDVQMSEVMELLIPPELLYRGVG